MATAGSNTVRWYDADGVFLFERGGSGGGPGEFDRLSRITPAAGDTVEPGLFRYPVPMLRLWAADGGRVDTLGMFPGTEVHIQAQASGGFIFGSHALGRELQYAVAEDRVYVGTAEGFEVNVYQPDGTWVRSIRAPDVNLAVTGATMDSLKSRQWARAVTRGAVTPAFERRLAEMAVPETRPAHGTLLVDAGQNQWVGEHRIDDRPERWAGFDAAGRSIGGVTLPEPLYPLYIDGAVILGRETDDLGVESLVAYAIER